MNHTIDLKNVSSLICKICIIVLVVICFCMILRWLKQNYKSISLKGNLKGSNNGIQPPPPLHMFGRSRSETIAINAFATILHEKGHDWQKLIVGYRPSFFKNPDTGSPLEIDAYYPDLKLGIEYNGIQHYIFPNYVNPDTPQGKRDFENGLKRDILKRTLAEENGIKIIEIPYYIDTCVKCKKNNMEWKYRKNSDMDKWNLIKAYLEDKMIDIV